MYPYEFVYHRPKSLDEAASLWESYDDPAFLSGGHTLIPTMKGRLASPQALIDVRAIADLHGISREGDRLIIGAATVHFAVSTSDVAVEAIPALARLAGSIADAQVRHMGTIGGSLANNDPAADYASAALSLDVDIITSRRVIRADEYFTGLFSTALEPGEIIVKVSFPIPDAAGYGKIRNQASRYAAAAAFVSRRGGAVRVAVTGAGNDGVFRWTQAEAALEKTFSAEALAGLQPPESDMIADMHVAADYRAHLVAVVTRRAMRSLGGADIT